jgi:hypothetical protein
VYSAEKTLTYVLDSPGQHFLSLPVLHRTDPVPIPLRDRWPLMIFHSIGSRAACTRLVVTSVKYNYHKNLKKKREREREREREKLVGRKGR